VLVVRTVATGARGSSVMVLAMSQEAYDSFGLNCSTNEEFRAHRVTHETLVTQHRARGCAAAAGLVSRYVAATNSDLPHCLSIRPRKDAFGAPNARSRYTRCTHKCADNASRAEIASIVFKGTLVEAANKKRKESSLRYDTSLRISVLKPWKIFVLFQRSKFHMTDS
jgi:hypothetical protein